MNTRFKGTGEWQEELTRNAELIFKGYEDRHIIPVTTRAWGDIKWTIMALLTTGFVTGTMVIIVLMFIQAITFIMN